MPERYGEESYAYRFSLVVLVWRFQLLPPEYISPQVAHCEAHLSYVYG